MAMDMTTALTIKANVVGQPQINKFGKSLGKVEKNATTATTGLRKLANAGNSLTGVLARVGIAATTANFIKAGIEADRTAKRLQTLTKAYGETAEVQKFAADMAGLYGLSQTQAADAVTDLFGRLRPMGISLEQIQTVFKGVNTAAGKMNLTSEQTSGVMLQLSQALGSGKLQGDEFRSIMEQLPAIGQAVATSLDVDVAALKELSSSGKITTDVIIKALEDLAQQPAPDVDAYKQFQASLADLSTTIGTQLLPALTPFVQFANTLLALFSKMPGPLKTLTAGLVALGAGFAVLAPAIPGIVIAFKGLAALKIGATLAGWAAVIPMVGSALAGLLPILAGVFTGPVGWAALLVGAGVALFTFRDKIGEFLGGLVQPFVTAFTELGHVLKQPFEEGIQFVNTTFFEPIKNIFSQITNIALEAMNGVFTSIQSAFGNAIQFVMDTFVLPVVQAIQSIPQVIANTFFGVVRTIQNAMNSALRIVQNIVNSIIAAVQRALQAIARLGGGGGKRRVKAAAEGAYWSGGFTPFAKGGLVEGPTLGLVGEAGPEYIVPARKAVGFANNILSGMRGPGAIPRFAEGGFVAPATANVNIQTGAVTRMGGQDFVTKSDMSRAVQSGVKQTLDLLRRDGTLRSRLAL